MMRHDLTHNGARRLRRHDSRLTAIWTFHRHGSLLRDQDRAPFGGQLGASTPNCLAYELPKLFPYGRRYGRDLRIRGPRQDAFPCWGGMKLVGPLAARLPGLRLALALEIERHGSADEILQGRLIDFVALVDVEGAPGIPLEAGIE